MYVIVQAPPNRIYLTGCFRVYNCTADSWRRPRGTKTDAFSLTDRTRVPIIVVPTDGWLLKWWDPLVFSSDFENLISVPSPWPCESSRQLEPRGWLWVPLDIGLLEHIYPIFFFFFFLNDICQIITLWNKTFIFFSPNLISWINEWIVKI